MRGSQPRGEGEPQPDGQGGAGKDGVVFPSLSSCPRGARAAHCPIGARAAHRSVGARAAHRPAPIISVTPSRQTAIMRRGPAGARLSGAEQVAPCTTSMPPSGRTTPMRPGCLANATRPSESAKIRMLSTTGDRTAPAWVPTRGPMRGRGLERGAPNVAAARPYAQENPG